MRGENVKGVGKEKNGEARRGWNKDSMEMETFGYMTVYEVAVNF